MLAALALTAVALFLARALGQARAERKISDTSYRWYFGWPAYIFLAMLSALGTINAAFVLFEGSSVVRQDIDDVRGAFSKLSLAAHRELTLPSHEKNSADLDGLLATLHQEIVNPNGGNYCGVGSSAEEILHKIRDLVPEMPIIRGTGAIKPCDIDKATRVYNGYADNAHAALNRNQAYLNFLGPEKSKFLDKLDRDVTSMNDELNGVEGLLSDVTAFSKPTVQQPLAKAASNYRADQAIFADFIRPAATGLPDQIDISSSQELGSIAAIMQIVSKRLSYPQTWSYLVFAILLDLGSIQLFTYIFSRRHELGGGLADLYRKPGQRPRFIWENPLTDRRKTIRHV